MQTQDPHNSGLKAILRRLLTLLKLNARYAITPGISIAGINVFRESRSGPHRFRALYALDHALTLKPRSVLDVGSGGGDHARAFVASGSRVLCVDYGTSIYATQGRPDGLETVNIDINRFVPEQKFELVWASHVLEHQRNVGQFIEKLVECCADHGQVCITLPDPHRNLWGGHLSIWSPGLLAYNIVLCGIDLSDATFVRGTNEFSIFFSPRRIELPAGLTYDSGDLRLLSAYLPAQLSENSDPWQVFGR